jgi:hypothetical protein
MLRISPTFLPIVFAAGIALTLAEPSRAACPAGSQFFAWGGAGGCVANGEQVRKCYHMPKDCQTGWSQEHQDDTGVWCCPPDVGKRAGSPPPPANAGCVWRGTAPFCEGECMPGEDRSGVSKTGDGERCVSGSKVLCCPDGRVTGD